MPSWLDKPLSNDELLFCGLSSYAIVNVVGIYLTIKGAFNSWEILSVLILCPFLGILGVIGAQLLIWKRPFTWITMMVFVFAMLLASYLNFLLLTS